jgi:hypothetical protein
MPIINEKEIVEKAKEIQAKITKTRSARALRAYVIGISEIMVKILEKAAIQVARIRKSVRLDRLTDETYWIEHKSFRNRNWNLWLPNIAQSMET